MNNDNFCDNLKKPQAPKNKYLKMKEQIEKLKAELREFIELSKVITPIPWQQVIPAGDTAKWNSWLMISSDEKLYKACKADYSFITRSRNISPKMAECLLVTINKLEFYNDNGCPGMALLEEILIIWEDAK